MSDGSHHSWRFGEADFEGTSEISVGSLSLSTLVVEKGRAKEHNTSLSQRFSSNSSI